MRTKKTLGFIGLAILIIATILLLEKGGVLGKRPIGQHTDRLEKFLCPRCENDPEGRKMCEKCGQTGFVWLDPTKYDTENLKLKKYAQ
jgi:hypothetical protein